MRSIDQDLNLKVNLTKKEKKTQQVHNFTTKWVFKESVIISHFDLEFDV